MTERLFDPRRFLLLLAFAVVAGAARQFAPGGLDWRGRWPTSGSSAREAYAMMARDGDPRFVSLQEAERLQSEGEAVFLDARARDLFLKGRIPGARSLPYYEIDQHQSAALEGVTAETPIVIYCEGIGCELSFFLGRDLQEAGYRNIGIFYGGYPEWTEAGLPIER